MCDATLTRRQLLRYGALVAATFPAARLLSPQWALADQAGTGTAVPLHLELVTVTDTEAAITWFTGDPTSLDAFGRPTPVAAPGRVLIGTSPDVRTWKEVGAHGPTAYHYVEVRGLRPGTTYYWRAESNGVPAVPAVVPRTDPLGGSAPPVFTTLVPPPGREIGRVAWLNDLHFGEQVAGLAYSNSALPGGGLPPGFPVDPQDPYWRFMGQGAVREARARGCDLLLANGDLSNESEPVALTECRRTLDAFGRLGGTDFVRPGDDPRYFVTRGNHDRWHGGAPHTSCEKRPGGLYDCFDDGFREGFVKGTQHFSVAVGDDRARYRFVGLDSNDGATTGVLRRGEMDYLAGELARGDITIPLFHHPASATAARTGLLGPVGYGLDTADATAFRQLLGRHDNVGGVYAGHTHRNNRTTNSETGTVPYFEGGAVKEYPGGYTVVRLFEGGYLASFWKTSTPEARAWSERSRGEYLGLSPSYQLGSLSDRSWTYDVDARRTVHAVTRPSATSGTTDPAALDGVHGSLAATGPAASLAATATAATVAGLALARLGRPTDA
ncbi:MAG: metallophosphoesterase [Nocardioidaceae bacterium]